MGKVGEVDFRAIAGAALSRIAVILDHLGVRHRRAGSEIEMINPLRNDRHFGSFRINTCTGVWSDFATGHTGGDVIALVAFLCGCRQIDAARRISGLLKTGAGQRHD